MSELDHLRGGSSAARGRERWIGAALGILVAAIDTFGAVALGVTFAVSGRDATVLVFAYLGGSFGLLGFLAGWLVEVRRREGAAAALARARTEEIHALATRVAATEKMATLGQLAAAIAHEVRNPLAIIRSAVQNLRETLPPDDEGALRSCTFVTDEIDRLTHVSSSLLGFARPLRPKPRSVSVAELLDRTELLAGRLLEPRRITLRRGDLAGPWPEVEADPDLVCQLLLGLLSNAAEVTPAGGEVRLAAELTGASVELSVADDGPGVPVELRDRIFEPFFTTREGGTGLGLAVAKQIVQAHGGRLTVEAGPRGGARFVVHLPSGGGAVRAGALGAAAPPAAGASA